MRLTQQQLEANLWGAANILSLVAKGHRLTVDLTDLLPTRD